MVHVSSGGARLRSKRFFHAEKNVIEPLEYRLLLADFTGTSGPDTIYISAYGEQIHVDINGTSSATSSSSATVDAEGGNDTIILQQIGSVPSWKPNIEVDLGDGDDVVSTDGASVDASNDGIVFVNGGAGTDSFEVDTTNSTRIDTFDFNRDASDYYLQAGPLHDGGFFYYNSSLENLTLDCNDQANVARLICKPSSTDFAINGAGGDDGFYVGATNAFLGTESDFSDINMGWAAGTTTLSGGVGTDIVDYYDKAASVDPGGYTLTSSTTSKGSSGVAFVTMESQVLKAANGNTINVNGTNVFTATTLEATDCTINLNALSSPTTILGSDCTVNAGNNDLDNLAAPITLEMSTILNADLLNIFDRTATADTTYIFNDDSFVARNSANPINFTGLDQVVLQAGSGNDDIAIDQTAAGLPISAFGNAGDDTLVLSQGDVHDSILAPVSFTGGDGYDTFFIANALTASSGVLTSSTYTEAGVTDTYALCELVHFVGGIQDSSSLDIESLTIPASIKGGSADDTFQVGAGDLDAVTGQVTIDGQGGDDSILVDDRLAPIANAFTIGSDLISTSNSFIQTVNVESETISGSDHDDSFNMHSSVPDLNILGNGGDDLIFSEGGSASIDTGSETPNTAGDSVVVNFGGSGSMMRLLNDDRIGELDIYNGGVFQVPAGVKLDVASLVATAGSVLDMGGAMIARNASGQLDQIAARLAAGYAAGSWNGTSTSTAVIDSSLAHSTSIADSIGYALASDLLGIMGTQTGSWQGETINPGDVLVKYTYAGDANLDGRINIDDYGRIDGNVARSGSVFGWFNGDFNYDNKINIDDYGIIDSGIGQQGPRIEQLLEQAGELRTIP